MHINTHFDPIRSDCIAFQWPSHLDITGNGRDGILGHPRGTSLGLVLAPPRLLAAQPVHRRVAAGHRGNGGGLVGRSNISGG